MVTHDEMDFSIISVLLWEVLQHTFLHIVQTE